MKYAKFSDDFLSYFRLDDNGKTLVLTDKRGYTRAVRLIESEGRWDEIQAGIFACPECGAYPHPDFRNFCPNCGLDMRKGLKDNELL